MSYYADKTGHSKECQAREFGCICGEFERQVKEAQNRPHEHDAYCVVHPRQAGYLVYCADCYLVAEATTEQEAWDKWNAGDVVRKEFDRSEIVG